jgi:hypothetical protein
MSKIALTPNASGTGTFTFAAPNSNSDRTLTLPDASGTLARTADIPTVNPFTLGTAIASTSGTAIDFTGIPSTAKRVTVMLSGVSFSGNPLSLLLRLGTSAGFDTTSDYDTSASNISSAVATSSAIDSIFYVTGLATFGATTIFSGAIVLSKVSGNTWVLSGSLVSLNVTSATIVSSGRKALSADLDRVRIFPNAGGVNFDAGTINISYEG